jgi:bifunctional UDP-N-acetylglucosamine pyrophosphorylase/glucosamine-1-phosphate N-acetyltransferase
LSETAAIILAAGKSTRMKTDLPKVLHEICGRPMLGYVINACRLAGVDNLAVVVGHGKDQVKERFENERDVTWVEQAEQRGTGHAVNCCRKALKGFSGSVLVVAGDMPLVRRVTLASLIQAREQSDDAVTLATTVLDDPTGYGRIIRDADGRLEAIVEHRDCTEEQRAIREVNPSYYCFAAKRLFEALKKVQSAPQTGEYYVTDAVRVLREAGHDVSATVTAAPEDAMGINSRLDLAVVGRAMQDRIQLALMNEGVTIVDPDNTWIEADAAIGLDTTVYPFSFIGAGASIGEGCRIGPFASVGSGETVPDGAVVLPVAINGAGVS